MSTASPSQPPPGFSSPPQQQQSPSQPEKGKHRAMPRNLALSDYNPHAQPVRPHDMSVPLFSLPAYQLKPPTRLSRAWRPNCHHSIMSTLYQVHERFKCDSCKRCHPFGWLYRCVMDREPLIIGVKEMGYQIAFDQLGHDFSEQMSLGKHGPEARSEKYSFLDEISQEQLCSYTPEELKEILAQRDHVHDVIADERIRPQDFNNQYGYKYPDDDRPWMPDPKFECQHKVCHRCHAIGRQKSWVSLDGVLNGDIPPTVATGYSFSQVRTRPCVDAETVKNLGYRPVPLPRGHKARASVAAPSISPTDIIDDHLRAESTDLVYDQDTGGPIASISAFRPAALVSPSTTAEPVFSIDVDGLWTRILKPNYAPSAANDDTESEDEEPFSFEFVEHNETAMEEAEAQEGAFGAAPLEVIEGVALTEEAVESGTADMVVTTTTSDDDAGATGSTTPTIRPPPGLSPISELSSEYR